MRKIILLLVIMVASSCVNAQKLKLVEGNLDYLKNQKELKVTFTYDNLKVGKMTEEAYVAKKVKDYNKKRPGTGDEWKEKWENDKENGYPEYFIRSFNMFMGKTEVRINKDADDAEYMMIVNTSFIEPGFNVGIQSKRASANFEISIVSTESPDKVLAKFTIVKSPGNSMFGANYSTVDRVGGCYESAASHLAGYFLKHDTFWD